MGKGVKGQVIGLGLAAGLTVLFPPLGLIYMIRQVRSLGALRVRTPWLRWSSRDTLRAQGTRRGDSQTRGPQRTTTM